MKPSIGRIVTALVEPVRNNGADVCPAIITRVWDDEKVNIKLFTDTSETIHRTSVALCADRQSAEDILATGYAQRACFWPERV
jgi:hypothetical protein